MENQLHHRVIVVGGGAAGLGVAARLLRAGVTDVAILEPSEQHYRAYALTGRRLLWLR
jgi:sulfide:quinone oxidoreductase